MREVVNRIAARVDYEEMAQLAKLLSKGYKRDGPLQRVEWQRDARIALRWLRDRGKIKVGEEKYFSVPVLVQVARVVGGVIGLIQGGWELLLSPPFMTASCGNPSTQKVGIGSWCGELVDVFIDENWD